MERHVCEQRQSAIQLRCRSVQRQSARLPAARRRKAYSQERRLIGDIQTLSRSSALTQHCRGKICHSRLARWICGTPAARKQHEIRKRKLMLLNDHELETVWQLARDDWRERYCRWRPELRWL